LPDAHAAVARTYQYHTSVQDGSCAIDQGDSMTDRRPNEAHSIDRYSTVAPTTQSHVFMELWQARCVRGYVAVHLHSKINLADLAKATQFSRCKFNRTFKASFGCTPGQFIRRMRIARAQNLMAMSGDPLCQIAAESGFADQSHFNRCFRKVVGESPAVWRARRCETGRRNDCSEQRGHMR